MKKHFYSLLVALALVAMLVVPASAVIYPYYMDVNGQTSKVGIEHYVYNKTYVFAMFPNAPGDPFYDKRMKYIAAPDIWSDVD